MVLPIYCIAVTLVLNFPMDRERRRCFVLQIMFGKVSVTAKVRHGTAVADLCLMKCLFYLSNIKIKKILSDVRCSHVNLPHIQTEPANDYYNTQELHYTMPKSIGISADVQLTLDHYDAVITLQLEAGYNFQDGTTQRTVICGELGKWSVEPANCKLDTLQSRLYKYDNL